MNRLTRRWSLLALLLVAVGAGALVPTAGAAPVGTARLGIAPARITVTATEFKYVLSKTRVAAGTTVIFTLVNKGKVAHNFRIAGKTTPAIGPGKTASITVAFAKAGKQAYLCTLPGHAAAGMKGVFTVAAPTMAVTVTATEFKYVLSRARVAAGTTVIFTLVNKGRIAHNFRIAGKTTAAIGPGKIARLTAVFAKRGSFAYLCTLPGHAAAGMKGVFTVTS